MKKYTVNGIEYSESEVTDYFFCKFCGANLIDGAILREDQYGHNFCEDIDCVWGHVMDCDQTEIEETIEEEEE